MGVLIVTRDLIPRLCAQCHDALRDARGRQELIDRLLVFAVDQTLRPLSIAAKNILFSICGKEERIIRHTFLQRQKNPFGGTLPKMQANRPPDQLLLRFIHRIHSSFLRIRETLSCPLLFRCHHRGICSRRAGTRRSARMLFAMPSAMSPGVEASAAAMPS